MMFSHSHMSSINQFVYKLIIKRKQPHTINTNTPIHPHKHISLASGMRKALQAEMGKVETERKIKELDSDKHDLERQCNELKNKCEQVERRGVELRLVYYIIIIV